MPLLIILLLFLLVILAAFITSVVVIRKIGRKLFRSLPMSNVPRSVMASLKESRRYGQLIVRTAQQYPPGPLRDRLDRLSKPVDQWLANLNRLEQGLRQLYGQRNLARERRQTKFEIDELRRRLLTVDGNEAVFLRELMQSKQNHLAVLKELQGFQTQAELKIRKIASDLGATHAEMLLLVAKGDFNENRFRRLDENLQEHVSSMRDVLGAMEELGYTSASG